MVSIQSTVAVTDHVFPARSKKVKTNVPFSVKLYHDTLSQLIASENQLMVARTAPLVQTPDVGL